MKTLRHLEVVAAAADASKGVFANVAIEAGETICSIGYGRVLRDPSRDTVQIGENAHVTPHPEELQSVNHSCDPNVAFDTRDMVLRALRSIEAGEELQYFYPSTEWEMADAFECECGSAGCLGRIEGAAGVRTELLNRYWLAPHILARLVARAAC